MSAEFWLALAFDWAAASHRIGEPTWILRGAVATPIGSAFGAGAMPWPPANNPWPTLIPFTD